jgi:NTE family protein
MAHRKVSTCGLPLDVALSGGGVRTLAFHAGVFKFLAQHEALERVRHISSASGGSLFMGLLMREAGMRWPSSLEYLQQVLPAIRSKLVSVNLQGAAARRLLLPWNWRYVLSRANVLAQALEACWGIHGTLAALPTAPIWSINGTTAQTGRRFRFKASECGDYKLGYASSQEFPLSHALAVSAAFPGGIGPLVIKTSNYVWRRRPSWDAPPSETQPVRLPYARLHLYDGGLYDNLGLEPLFDAGVQRPKTDGAALLVSDAGAPLSERFAIGPLNPWRMKRWLDLQAEQQRALRVRGFIHAIRNGMPGAYLQIGTRPHEQLTAAKHANGAAAGWLCTEDTSAAASCPTMLARLPPATFDLLCRHGHETAHWNELAYPYLVASDHGAPAQVQPGAASVF